MPQKTYLKKAIALTLISFGASLMLMSKAGTFELKAYDLFSRHLNPSRPVEDIVLVQVDQESLDALSRQGITWPWPRQVYAPIIEYASQADAIFIDILFTEQSSYGLEDDKILSTAIGKASNVYLPVFLSKLERPMTSEDEKFIEKISLKGMPYAQEFNSAITPIDVLKETAIGGGNVTISPDEDGVYRRVPLLFGLKQTVVPHFVLDYLIKRGVVRLSSGSIYVRDRKIPLFQNTLMLRYLKGEKPFRSLSASGILGSYAESKDAASVKRDFFRGKVVFIGLTAAGLYDLKPTAVYSKSSGMFIHATALENMLHENFISPVGNIYVFSLMFLICFLSSFFLLRQYLISRNMVLFLSLMFVSIAVPAILFKNGLYMNIISLLMSLSLSFIVGLSFSYAMEGKERRFIRRTFSQYMDKTIADYILKNPSVVKHGGVRKRVTVFFADIAGFTALAESIPAEEIAKMLHTALNHFTEVIIRNKGVIDKYIGDAVMAFWGAPLGTEEDETNACLSALQCAGSLTEINRILSNEGIPGISIRIGINSGDAVAGNLGSDRLFDYTIVGDTVNLASRLESVNKLFKTEIAVSEDTLAKTGDVFLARELGIIGVKGKSQPVRVFELIGEKRKIGTDKERLVEMFQGAMALYNEGLWHEAERAFDDILSVYTSDGPSEFYRKRCRNLIENPQYGEKQVISLSEK